MRRQALIASALGLVALIGSGCASWKHADAGVGRAFTPGVSAVTVEGRKLLRLRGRVSSALIDPDGGRVVDFHLAPPAKWFFVDDPDDPDRKRVVVEDAPPVGATSPATWEVSFTPTNDTLERATYWQADVSPARVVLLSDKAGGLRCRKEFQIRRTGELDIAVSVRNVSGKAVKVSIVGHMHVMGGGSGMPALDASEMKLMSGGWEMPARDVSQMNVKGDWPELRAFPREPSTNHQDSEVFESMNTDKTWRLTRQWRTESTEMPAISSLQACGEQIHDLGFGWKPIPAGGEITWRETWTLTRGR